MGMPQLPVPPRDPPRQPAPPQGLSSSVHLRPERSLPPPRCARPHPRAGRRPDMFGLVLGWVIIVGLIGFALMAIAPDKLQIVIRTMQGGVGKSLGSGLIGQLAIVPGAVAVCVLLAATLIGILLIPLGLVAFMFLVAGIAMFGFIA